MAAAIVSDHDPDQSAATAAIAAIQAPLEREGRITLPARARPSSAADPAT
jgi:hypothetical protein